MKFRLFLLMFSCFISQAAEQKMVDPEYTNNNTEDCQHLAGEWDSNLPQVQQRYIEEQIDMVCPKAK